jgi:hypothetical protein
MSPTAIIAVAPGRAISLAPAPDGGLEGSSREQAITENNATPSKNLKQVTTTEEF